MNMLCRLVLALLLLSSCSRQLVPPAPVLPADLNVADTLPVSDIQLPVRIALTPLKQWMEASMQRVYTSPGYPLDFVVENCSSRYMYRFQRGPLQLTMAGRELQLRFTGSYMIAGAQRICTGFGSDRIPVSPWSPTCSCGLREDERKVEVTLLMQGSLQPDYQVDLKLRRAEPRPLNRCTVCLWEQDLTPLVMKQLSAQLDMSMKEVEDSLRRLNLRPQFQQLWNRLEQPLPMGGFGFLQVQPRQIQLGSVQGRGDTLLLQVGLQARPLITSSAQPKTPGLIPNLTQTANRNTFSIYVDAQLSYDSLSTIMDRNLKGKRFDIEQVGKTVTLQSCQVYGADHEKLVLRVEYAGSQKGILYLVGRPRWDREKQELRMDDLQYDIRTSNLLTRSASWLFNRRILEEIRKAAVIDWKTQAQQLIVRMNQQLNRTIYPGMILQGQVSQLEPWGIYPFRDRLQVRIGMSGQLSLLVQQLAF